jgi:hypothetical protein
VGDCGVGFSCAHTAVAVNITRADNTIFFTGKVLELLNVNLR